MAKLIVVVGLPGSGKSHYVREQRSSCTGVCAEDYMANSQDDSSRFTDSRYYSDLVRDLREGKDCVIADIEYCDTWRRVEVEEVISRDVPGVAIEWHYFENNPSQCEANVNRRGRGTAEEETRKIHRLSRKYQIPPGAKVLSVWATPGPKKCLKDRKQFTSSRWVSLRTTHRFPCVSWPWSCRKRSAFRGRNPEFPLAVWAADATAGVSRPDPRLFSAVGTEEMQDTRLSGLLGWGDRCAIACRSYLVRGLGGCLDGAFRFAWHPG